MSTENRNINIYINSAEAEKAYDNLEQRNKKLREQLEKTQLQQKKLVAAIALGDKEAIKENEKLITKTKELSSAISTNADRMDRIKKKLKGEISPAYNDLANAVTKLKRELNLMSKEDDGFAEKVKQYNEAKLALDRYARSMISAKNSWNDMLKNAKSVAFGMIVGNTVDRIASTTANYFSGLVEGSAKLSDELSNVKKAANLTDAEVQALNSSFKDLQTRTSNTDLRNIAVGLGQIGESVTTENVDAINKIIVALGDEFSGGATQITNELSVLRNNLQDIKSGQYDQDMLSIGNALNTLGAEGLATGEKTVDIANRISGVASVYNITAGQILGTAASFQELGINVERGSTAYVKILQRMAKDTETFAKVAGMDIKQFEQLVNTDMNAAFLAVAKGSKDAAGSNVEFAKVLSELEADGAGVSELLSKFGSNTQLVTDKINLATGALKQQNSILDEYNEKNNNTAGQLEKLKKNFNSFKESKALNDILASGIKLLSSFFAMLSNYPGVFKLLATATAAYTAQLVYNYAMANKLFIIENARMLRDKAEAAFLAVKTIAMRAYGVAVEVVAGRLTLAAAAKKAYDFVMASTNPYTLAITAITAVATALVLYYNKAQDALTASKALSDATLTAKQNTAAERVEVEMLLRVANNENLSKAKRLEAIEQLNKIVPQYHGNLTLETLKTKEADAATKAYINSLVLKAKVQEVQDKLVKARLKQEEVETKKLDELQSWDQEFITYVKFMFTGGDAIVNERKKLIANAEKEVNIYTKLFDELQDQMQKTNTTPTAPNDKIISSIIGSGKDIEILSKQRDELAAFLKKLQEVEARLRADSLPENDRLLLQAHDEFVALGEEAKKFIGLAPGIQDTIRKLDQTKQGQVLSGINLKNLEADYNEALNANNEFFALIKAARKQEYAQGLISEYQYNRALSQINIDELEVRLTTATNYQNAGLIKAGEDRLKIEKDINDAVANQAIADAKELESLKATEAGVAVSKAKRLGEIDQIKQAEMQQLMLWYATEQNLNRGNKAKLLEIEEEYQTRLAAITNKANTSAASKFNLWPDKVLEKYRAIVSEISTIAGAVSNVIGNISGLLKQQTDNQIAEIERRSDAETQKLQKDLDNKLISQEKYEQKKADLDNKYNRQLHQLRVKQFEQEQAMKLIQASINVALGVTQAIAQGGTSGIITGALVAAAGAVEIAYIASAKPPSYGEGTILNGPKHSDKSKGLPIVNPYTGQVLAYVEGGEAVIPDDTTRANRPLIDYMLANKGKSVLGQLLAAQQIPSINTSRLAENIQMANGGYIAKVNSAIIQDSSQNMQQMQLMSEKYLKEIAKYSKNTSEKELSISNTELKKKNEFLTGAGLNSRFNF